MNATNRPIDILLNTESLKNTTPGARDSDVTDSNIKEKSFDSVMSEQQDGANRSDPREDGERRVEEKSSPQPARHERQDSQSGAEQSGNEVAEDGKALPPETEEDNKETASLELDAQLEAFVLGNDDTDHSGAEPAEGEKGISLNAEQTAQAETVVPLGLKTEEISVPGKRAAETGTTKATDNVSSGYQQPVLNQARITPPPLMPEGIKSEDAETEIKMTSGLFVDNKKSAKALNLNGEFKLDLSGQGTKQHIPLGQELKQWLGEARSSRENPGQAVIASQGASGNENATTAANPLARLDGLTQAMQNIPTQRAGMVSMSVNPTVNSAGWGQVVAQRIAWMANNGINAAELQLNPRALGPLEVSVSVSNEQANIHFTSQHAGVREALELSVQRLREMLESNGLNLADVNVSDQSLAEQREFQAEQSAAGGVGNRDEGENGGDLETDRVRVVESASLVDYYA